MPPAAAAGLASTVDGRERHANPTTLSCRRAGTWAPNPTDHTTLDAAAPPTIIDRIRAQGATRS